MKYIIDGLTKQTSTLARLYKYLNEEDSFLVYDDSFEYPENYDVIRFTSAVIENGKATIPQDTDNDSRRFKMTKDFETALENADCYINFQSLQYIQEHVFDLEEADRLQKGILERLALVQEKNKKLFLGNMFSPEYENIIKNYENCINTIITKTELQEMKKHRADVFGAGDYLTCNITMIVGTGMACGKFSCAMDVKAQYEAQGEKVVMIHTEESAPFLKNDGSIFTFCRNFSDLTTDEDFVYLQGLVAKIYAEQKPDRIIFVTQAGLSDYGITYGYTETDNGRKMKGIYDILISQSFGVHTVIIAGNWNLTDRIERIIRYYNIDQVNIDSIYFSPMTNQRGADFITVKDEENEYSLTIPPKGSVEDIQNAMQGLALRYPYIKLKCFYSDLNEKIEAYKNNDFFQTTSAALFAQDIYLAARKGIESGLLNFTLDQKLNEEKETITEDEYTDIEAIIKHLEESYTESPENNV